MKTCRNKRHTRALVLCANCAHKDKVRFFRYEAEFARSFNDGNIVAHNALTSTWSTYNPGPLTTSESK